jgi:hypothetical protein
MKTVLGLFDNFSDAQQAVDELRAAGFNGQNLSIVASERTAHAYAETIDPDATVAGAAGGALAGTLLGALAGAAIVAVPGGPILAAGPLIAGAVAGAVGGAGLGGLIGALVGTGVPEEEARLYQEGVRRGGVLVAVAAPDDKVVRVVEIMNRHNPVDIEARAEQWRAAGWHGTTPAAAGTSAPGTPTGGTGAGSGGRYDQKRETATPESGPSRAAGSTGDTGAGARVPVTSSGVSNADVDEFTTSGNSLGANAGASRDAGSPAVVGVEVVEVAFEQLEPDFRSDWERTRPGASYDEARPDYRYGYEWANRGQGREWSSVEGDVRRDWESRNPGGGGGGGRTWDKVRDAVRSAYDRARPKR